MKNPVNCPKCLLRKDCCICPNIPHVSTFFDLTILIHPREFERKTNTGKLIPWVMDATMVQWERTTDYSAFQQHQAALLFPDTDTCNAENIQPDRLPRHLVLLDGTWQEAKKMLNRSQNLNRLRRLSLPSNAPSTFCLRRNQQALCSFETFIKLVELSGDTDTAATLSQFFARYQAHYKASESGHAVNYPG